MLDLLFFALMVVVMFNAIRGRYLETAANVAFLIGILSSVIGIVITFTETGDENVITFVLRILVLVITFMLRPAARHFVKLHADRVAEEQERLERELEHLHRFDIEDGSDFNDPSARFNGEYNEVKHK